MTIRSVNANAPPAITAKVAPARSSPVSLRWRRGRSFGGLIALLERGEIEHVRVFHAASSLDGRRSGHDPAGDQADHERQQEEREPGGDQRAALE